MAFSATREPQWPQKTARVLTPALATVLIFLLIGLWHGISLNAVYFGHGAYGIETAARTYFDKSATYNSTSGKWEVTAKIAATVEETAAETAAAILTEESTTGKVTVPTGLYYKVTRMEELGTPVEDPVTGMSNGQGVSVTKPGTTQGFIQVEISTSSFE